MFSLPFYLQIDIRKIPTASNLIMITALKTTPDSENFLGESECFFFTKYDLSLPGTKEYIYMYIQSIPNVNEIHQRKKTAPLLADLFLYSYEADCIQGLLKKNKRSYLNPLISRSAIHMVS
jgi:hypothetical protein